LTADVDVTVDLGARPTRDLVDELLAAGFHLRVRDAEEFVERTRVLPMRHVATPPRGVAGGHREARSEPAGYAGDLGLRHGRSMADRYARVSRSTPVV
jgi:hypothetical protein